MVLPVTLEVRFVVSPHKAKHGGIRSEPRTFGLAIDSVRRKVEQSDERRGDKGKEIGWGGNADSTIRKIVLLFTMRQITVTVLPMMSVPTPAGKVSRESD